MRYIGCNVFGCPDVQGVGNVRRPAHRREKVLAPMQSRCDIQAIVERGARWHLAGNLEQAAESYVEALRADPGHPEALARLGAVELQRRRYGAAVTVLRDALTCNPRAAGIHYNLGLACQGIQDLEGAEVCFQQALSLRPGLADAWYSLGHLHFGEGRYRAAGAALERAAALRPDHVNTADLLGQTLCHRGQYAAATAWLRRAAAMAPDRAMTRYWLGFACARMNRLAEALAAFEVVLSAQPANAECHFQIGHVQLRQGRARAALESFRRAVQLMPGSTRVWHALLEALQAVNPDPDDRVIRQGLLACLRREDIDPVRVRHLVSKCLLTPPVWHRTSGVP